MRSRRVGFWILVVSMASSALLISFPNDSCAKEVNGYEYTVSPSDWLDFSDGGINGNFSYVASMTDRYVVARVGGTATTPNGGNFPVPRKIEFVANGQVESAVNVLKGYGPVSENFNYDDLFTGNEVGTKHIDIKIYNPNTLTLNKTVRVTVSRVSLNNYTWKTDPIGGCNASCIQNYNVTCIIEGTTTVVDNSFCDPNTRPSNSAACTGGACPPPIVASWQHINCGECDAGCEEQGERVCTVACVDQNNNIVDKRHCSGAEPSPVLNCVGPACPPEVCDEDHPWFCYDWVSCVNAGGHWWGNECHTEPEPEDPPPPAECDEDHLYLCNIFTCEAAGGHWWNNKCNPLPEGVSLTPTGFVYPLGFPPPYWPTQGFWLSCEEYKVGQIHAAVDMASIPKQDGLPVYSIGEGKVLKKDGSIGWGKTNFALLIGYTLIDGTNLFATFGHVHSDLSVDEYVQPGQLIGTLGPWGDFPHVHFAIVVADSIPSPWYGVLTDSSGNCDTDQVDLLGHVDPLEFIETQTPGPYLEAGGPDPPTPSGGGGGGGDTSLPAGGDGGGGCFYETISK